MSCVFCQENTAHIRFWMIRRKRKETGRMLQKKTKKNRGKYRKPMSKRKKKAIAFVLGFCLFAIVFSSAAAVTLYLDREKGGSDASSTEQAAKTMPGKLRILVAGGKTKENHTAFYIAELDGDKTQVLLETLDTETPVALEGKTLTLPEHDRDGGVRQVQRALEDRDIDRYISFDMNALIKMMDQMDGLVFDVPEGNALPVGKQKLSGGEIKMLLDSAQNDLSGKLLKSFINAYLTAEHIKLQDKYFLMAVNNTQTDITAHDLYKFKDILGAIANNQDENKVFLLDKDRRLIPE